MIGQLIQKRSLIIGRLKPMKRQSYVPKEETASLSKKMKAMSREAIEEDTPNFHMGSKKIYFPFATIKLLRPNAKHTPYQAKFIVPKSFNKMDLRDYLYNIYNLRVLNVSSALMPAVFTRNLPAPYGSRFRTAQIKKMTVDLIDPFVWPAETEDFNTHKAACIEMDKYRTEKSAAVNSDKLKPSKAFGGILDPNPTPMNFVSKNLRRKMKNIKSEAIKSRSKIQKDTLILENIDFN